MTRHALSPGYVKLHYSVVISTVAMEHVAVLPVNLTAGGEGSASQITTKAGTPTAWATIVGNIFDQLKTQFNNGAGIASFSGAELFSQFDETSAPFWEDAYFATVVGTNAGAAQTAVQSVFAFRSDSGGVLKVTMIEASNVGNLRQVYAQMTTAQKALADYFMGNTNGVIARDGGWPHQFLHLTTKVNDKVRKHRFNL
jgi:hypothetical protein